MRRSGYMSSTTRTIGSVTVIALDNKASTKQASDTQYHGRWRRRLSIGDLCVTQVRPDCEEVTEPGEDVAALGDPRHRLDPERVDREEERREGRAQSPRQGIGCRGRRASNVRMRRCATR